MNILFSMVFFLEFLFHGYCVYIYCSSIFRESRNKTKNLLLFLLASMSEYFIYKFFNNLWVNVTMIVLCTALVCIICFKTKIILCFLHSFLISGIFVMIELVSVPIVDFFMSDNYLATHSVQSEILSSTITKIIFFIVCNVIKQVSEFEIKITKSIWLFLVPLMSLVCGLSVTLLCNDEEKETFDNFLIIFAIGMLTINLVVFCVHESYVKTINEMSRIKLLEQKEKLDYEHYKLLQIEYNNSRILVHDIKHHIDTISTLVNQKDEKGLKKYIKSFKNQNFEFYSQYLTGNKIIDIIIHQKSEICRKQGIKFIFKSNNIKFDFIDEADICCILSNLIDNAIEASRESKGKKIELNFYCNNQKTIYFIDISNDCDIPPMIENGVIITRKNDKRNHGIGLYSIERTLKKYSGYLTCDYDNNANIFKTTITIEDI